MSEEGKKEEKVREEGSVNRICKEHEDQLRLRLAPLVIVFFGAVAVLVGVGIIVLLAALPPVVIALIVGAAIVVLLAVGATLFRLYTISMKALYAAGTLPRPGTTDPPTYAAWYAAQNWLVRAVAVSPAGC